MKQLKIIVVIVISMVALGLVGVIFAAVMGVGRLSNEDFMSKTIKNSITNETVLSAEGVKEITIDYDNSPYDVYVYTTKEKEIKIKEVVDKGSEFAAIQQNESGNLTVKSQKPPIILFDFRFLSGNHYTEIYIPDSYSGKIEVNTVSGDIESKDTFTLKEEASFDTTSGAIMVENMNASDLTFSTTSGSILVKKSNGGKTIATISGEITMEGGKGNAAASTTSGDIILRDFAGVFDAETTSGDINIEDEEGSGKANSISGDITVELGKVTGNIKMNATSGELLLKIPAETEFSFDAETTSGDISTFFDDNLSYNRRENNASGKVGKKDNIQIRMNSTSGDIDVGEN